MQRNLRIVSENAADSAEITVANTAAGLGAEWLKTEDKSEVCRILSDTGSITATWVDPVGVDCVALPAWNASASAEIRVECFSDTAGTNLIWDSGWVWAAPGPQLESWDFSQPLNVNGFAEGASVSVVWVPNLAVRRVVISLRDPNRAYLDISRLVIGTAFSLCGASYGTSASTNDRSVVTRTAGGDIRIDKLTKSRTMNLDMSQVDPLKRHQVTNIINQGLGKRHLFSGYARDDVLNLQQELTMYGILTTVPTLTHVSWGIDGSQFQVEEW